MPGPRDRRRAAPARFRARSRRSRARRRSRTRFDGMDGSRQRATSSSNARAKASRCRSSSDRPAAIAWPPKRLMSSGWRVAMPSSTSRMWMPGTERAEPRNVPSALRANAMTGRRTRSLMRLATSPTTPWCQSASNRHTPWRVGAFAVGLAQALHRRQRHALHARFDLAALDVQLHRGAWRAPALRLRCPRAGSGCRSTCRRAGRRR